MNPSKNVRASGQGNNIPNQNSSINNSSGPNLIGQTVVNTVYMSQNPQNIRQSNQASMVNPTVKSNYVSSQQQKSHNNMIPNTVSTNAQINQSQHSGVSVFQPVLNGTQMRGSNTMSQNPNVRNSVQNMNGTVTKNGKVLKNVDLNQDTSSYVSGNSSIRSNLPQQNNPQYNNNINNSMKVQSVHVSKDKSMMSQAASQKMDNTINQKSFFQKSNNPQILSSQQPQQSALASQKASQMKSNINNINASKQSLHSSFPVAPTGSNIQNNNNTNPSVKPIDSTLRIVNNKIVNQNRSELNNPANMAMSNIPASNPYQSAMINKHQNLPIQSQINKNQSVQNSLNPQQVQSIRQSQQNPQQVQSIRQSQQNPQQVQSIRQSQQNPQQIQSIRQSQQNPQQIQSIRQSQQNVIQSNLQNSRRSQNPNMNIQTSQQQLQQSLNNSTNRSLLRKSSLRASRNKSPPMVVKTKDGQIVSTQADSHGNQYTTEEEKSVSNINSNIKDNQNVQKEVNNKAGKGFRFYGQISKPGRNQNGQSKTNQDTALIHPNVGGISGFNLFGVLDGHGPHGHFVSQFCRDYFIRKADEFANQCKKEGISTPEAIYNKLKQTKFAFIKEVFKNSDTEIANNTFDHSFSGTTCNLVFQFNKYLIDASVGDSRSILVFDSDNSNTNQGIFPLSNDHKPDLPQELERIMNKGGKVDKLTDQFGNKVGPNRVFKIGCTYPGLAMSRSLGDFQAKECGVIAEPLIIEQMIGHKYKYMVICSDGVWEFLKNEDVRDLGNQFYPKGEVGPFCTELVKRSVQAWEQLDIIRDDITVVCVYF